MTRAGREARRRSHTGSRQASAVYTIDGAVILGRCGGFAQVSCGEHCNILFKSLMFVNLAASLWVDHGHLSLYTTLLSKKFFVLTGFSLGGSDLVKSSHGGIGSLASLLSDRR